MGQNKRKTNCESHLPHGRNPGSTFVMNKGLQKKAEAKFPQYDWKSIRIICMDCKGLILKLGTSCGRRKRRGRKLSNQNASSVVASSSNIDQHAGSSRNNPPPISTSAQPNIENSEPANDSQGSAMVYEVNDEHEIEIDGSQEYMQSSTTSQSTPCVSQTASEVNDFFLEDVNTLLGNLHISPLKKSSLQRPYQLRETWKKAVTRLNDDFNKLTEGKYVLETDKDKECEFCETLFVSLCARYRDAKTKEEKYHILTSLPGRYNAKEIQKESGCTYYAALQAMSLKVESGVFSAPKPKVGNPIPQDVVDLVLMWYEDDNNSRPSPLMNLAIGPMTAKVARRHMYMNQIEAYALFKTEFPYAKIKKTKFVSLCPKECVWPKHRPYHNFCVCVTCANFEFLYAATGNSIVLKDFLKTVQCQPVRQECAYGLCEHCLKMNEVLALLGNIDSQEVTYKQWQRTDGTELQRLTVPVQDFSNLYTRLLVGYVEHIFVKEKQKEYIKLIKSESLRTRRALLIVVDFAQNYTVVVQNAVQGHHWSAKQVTVLPFCVLWFDQVSQTYKEKAYVVISDEMHHDADTFNCFKRKVISHIKEDFRDFKPAHIYYVSDNAGSQFKNFKNFAHLTEHHEKFGMTAEWIFTAAGHGKGSADRVAAVVKSTTQIHSLKGHNFVLNAHDMYLFLVGKLENEKMKFLYVTKEEVAAERDSYIQLYSSARKLRGTRTYHHIVALPDGKVRLYKVGGSDEFETFNMMRNYTLLYNPEDVSPGDFMCFVEARSIQIGMFIERDDEYAEFQCLKISRRNFELRWPAIQVYLKVALIDILLKVEDPLPHVSGRYLTYAPEQIEAMKAKFDLWNEMRH